MKNESNYIIFSRIKQKQQTTTQNPSQKMAATTTTPTIGI